MWNDNADHAQEIISVILLVYRMVPQYLCIVVPILFMHIVMVTGMIVMVGMVMAAGMFTVIVVIMMVGMFMVFIMWSMFQRRMDLSIRKPHPPQIEQQVFTPGERIFPQIVFCQLEDLFVHSGSF